MTTTATTATAATTAGILATTATVGSRFAPRPAHLDGFVHAHDGHLVDGAGRQLLLRGIGLGNWLLPEGYMWRFGAGAQSPRQIETLVDRLAGADYGAQFWPRFREAFLTETDVVAIAAAGFDHVRVPINARVVQHPDGRPREDGLALLDRLIGWCRTHRLWVLLDLHGAPGGQTGTNIDDSPRGLPELFMDATYRERTLRLWRDLAERYARETTVLGYDLLNEPLPHEWQHRYADELVDLYRDLTTQIRAVDPDHLIVYEGSHWATNWDVFTQVWDENSLLQFHKYWSSPDRPSIARYLRTRDELGLPIYMGEGGENTLEWIYTAFRLYESEGIGWNLWPWKKIDTRTSPVSVVAPEGWAQVVAAAEEPEGTPAISPATAQGVLDDLLEAMRFEHATWQPDVVAAATGCAPARLPAWGFGFRGAGRSYATAAAHPLPGIREDDAVSIRFTSDQPHPENPFQQTDGRPYAPEEQLMVELGPGDWLEYELEGDLDPSAVRVLGPQGTPAPVRVERVERGLRVSATAPASLCTLHLRGTHRP
ncbi:glycoside hydrolase family 5 protein [Cellulomonas soli]|uniref:glycoside hydrolase family 5 protein n=1 Tax=Cellulomonas soli TaxID=931535 RepID=UPI003F873866